MRSNKRLITRIGAAMFASLLMFGGSAYAFDTDERQKKIAEERLADIMKEFQPTGEVRQCISVTRLRSSKAIDDQTIFFEERGKTGYMNKLPHKCANLQYENRFTYTINTGTRLCRGEIITVLDSFGRSWGSCTLGSFEEWKEVEKDSQEGDGQK